MTIMITCAGIVKYCRHALVGASCVCVNLVGSKQVYPSVMNIRTINPACKCTGISDEGLAHHERIGGTPFNV